MTAAAEGRRFRSLYGRLACGTLAAAVCAVAHAGVTLDGSMGRAGTLPGPVYSISVQAGKSDAAHHVLFHSFGEFSIGNGEKAIFTGPLNTENIVVRVTGGQISSINGLIDTRTSMPS